MLKGSFNYFKPKQSFSFRASIKVGGCRAQDPKFSASLTG